MDREHDGTMALAYLDTVAEPRPTRIAVRSLTKRFHRRGGGEIVPVDDVTLDVASGEMLVLLGPSGCGKTTLLRCIAGLEVPDAGEIVIDGRPVFSSSAGIFLPPNLRPVSMVFQSYALWPHMTVFENVAYPLQSRGVRSADVQARVRETLEFVELAPLAKQYPAQISGGQQQRVALARAVVSGSGVVLFDEPLSNVDAKVREQLRGEIVRMQRKLGFTGLYVTHDQVEAMAIGDRVAVLRSGKIDQVGPPEEIYTRPANRNVGTFIGSPNILSGRVSAVRGRRATVGTAVGTLDVEASGRLSAPGDTVAVVVRPETFRIAVARPASENGIAAIVETRAFLGAYTEYMVKAGEGRLRVWAFGGAPLAPGAEIWLSVAPADLALVGDDGASAAEVRN
jgi:iron(III) transport system ATP-binding protein